MSNDELALQQPTRRMGVASITVAELVTQRNLIKSAMKNAMEDGVHYGKIPGCGDKNTLLLPGAQTLCSLFQIRPEYEISERILQGDHKTYQVKCRLFTIGSSVPVGEGVGEASTMESKYRFRNAAAEFRDTGEELPKQYWQIKNTQGPEKAAEWLRSGYDGKRVGPKKVDDVWKVVEFLGSGDAKIENPNLTDTHNTVLKIAKKRAFVDATINTTASSDFFTQDMEDVLENEKVIGEIVESTPNLPGITSKAAGSHKAPAKVETAAQGTPAAHGAGNSDGWRGVKVHFGNPSGPILGKTLGYLADNDPGRMDWLLKTMREKTEKQRGPKGDELLAALIAWQDEKNGVKTVTPGHAENGGKELTPEERAETNLESLATNLEFIGISNEAFLRVAIQQGWTDAERFEELPPDDVAKMIADNETISDVCRAAMANTKEAAK